MPECHKCPYNGTGNPICLSCAGPPDTNHRGRSHISIDAGDDAQTLGEVAASIQQMKEADQHDGHKEPAGIDAARRVLHEFVTLADDDVRLVCSLMRGESMAAVAKREGLTRATISWRVKRLVAKHPVFSFLRQG
jgi:hypothetical protein